MLQEKNFFDCATGFESVFEKVLFDEFEQNLKMILNSSDSDDNLSNHHSPLVGHLNDRFAIQKKPARGHSP